MSDAVARLNAALGDRYRIERMLGEGGMATVYLADDLRHERQVALKVLKPELAAVLGAERFLAEIKTTANLRHPHILPLFDSGEADGFLFYVMPFVQGETLRQKLDREHQLPVPEAVAIAEAVAQALQHAHDRGVIHRDVKPANILMQDGQPVVSDFGIAFAVSEAGGGRLTETGISLGTPHYMSPEQASADREPTAASDVYSLGCVLYEMLVGEPPYTAGSTPAVLAKILMEDATAPRQTRKSIPVNVDAAILKALEKLPADRFTTIRDFASALEDPGFRHTEGRAGPVGARGLWNPLAVTASGLAAMLALALGWSTLGHTAPTPSLPVSRQVISAAPAAPLVTSRFGDVAISPDGRTVVYQTAIEPGRLAVRPIDRLTTTTFPGLGGGELPFLSPDGLSVGFQAQPGGPLQRISIQGGPPQTIVDLPMNLTGASWGPDDRIVFSVDGMGGLYQVPATGGEAARLTETDGSVAHQYPDVLPNGAGILFTIDTDPTAAADNQIAVLDLRSGDTRVIIPAGTGARFAATGHIVYALGDSLMAVAFDSGRLEAIGDPVPVQGDVLARANGLADFDISETGSLVYVGGSPRPGPRRTLVWVDREGDEQPLPLPPDHYAFPRASPDGTRVAVTMVSEEDGGGPLWVFDVATGIPQRLTRRSTRGPVWVSNDRLAFAGSDGSRVKIFTVAADASAPAEVFPTNENIEGIIGDFPAGVTPDGNTLIFVRLITAAYRAVLQVPLQGEPTAETLIDDGASAVGSGKVSPDGRWLAYWSDRSGQMEIYVAPYLRPGPQLPVSLGGGMDATWSPDGTELFYRVDDRMMAASFDGSDATPRIGPPTKLFEGPYVVPPQPGNTPEYHIAPDGRFLMLEETPGDDAESPAPPEVVLVQNFFEELNRLVPR